MSAVDELFAALPLEVAMPELRPVVPSRELPSVRNLAALLDPMQLAALLIYVDELNGAHQLVQDDDSMTSAWLHAIIHRREGDFSNSLYWYGQAKAHPEISKLSQSPREFVQAASKGGEDPALVKLQREEWKLVFDYAVREGL
jgi:hypothetical protein